MSARSRNDGARAAAAAALVLAALPCGCVATQAASDDATKPRARGYFAARGRELARILDLTLSFGPGLGARVSATRHFQAGAVVVDTAHPSPRHLRPVNVTVGLRDGEAGAWSLRKIEYGLSPWYRGEALVRPVPSAAAERLVDPSSDRGSRFSAEAQLGLVGAEIGFDPLALVRFVAGVFGLGEAGFFDDADPAGAAPPTPDA